MKCDGEREVWGGLAGGSVQLPLGPVYLAGRVGNWPGGTGLYSVLVDIGSEERSVSPLHRVSTPARASCLADSAVRWRTYSLAVFRLCVKSLLPVALPGLYSGRWLIG